MLEDAIRSHGRSAHAADSAEGSNGDRGSLGATASTAGAERAEADQQHFEIRYQPIWDVRNGALTIYDTRIVDGTGTVIHPNLKGALPA